MNAPFPDEIAGYGPVRPFGGALNEQGIVMRAPVTMRCVGPKIGKRLFSIRAAIEVCEPTSGAAVSFHLWLHYKLGGRRLKGKGFGSSSSRGSMIWATALRASAG